MNFIQLQSKKILECYSNKLEKSNITYEWRTVKGPTKTFERRYKVKIGGDDTKSEHNPLGTKNTQNSAALSDRLLHGVNHNGVFYDNKGERIHLTPEQLVQAKKEYSQQSKVPSSINQREVDKGSKAKKDQILEQVKHKDPLYLKHVEKLKDSHEKNQGEEVKKRRINSFLESITKNSSPSHILQHLKWVRNEIKDEIDPTLEVSVNKGSGQSTNAKRSLDTLISYFEKKDAEPIKFDSIKIEHLDQYGDNDFEKQKFKIDPKTHQEIYNKINKKLGK